ncbi:hypothetical protein PHYBOEH_008946 [Phytophthora boehmeriae]|uniref:Phosphoglycerate mutase family n=1 Tax=Phytophthora boehmeriae TaxID=109152 RepID=A0A8T1WZG8_9STRA|nr:hypothetical protein PHYBOEH_008946 [Phytophthora boehmeriae]
MRTRLRRAVTAVEGFFVPKEPIRDSQSAPRSLFKRFELVPSSWGEFQTKLQQLEAGDVKVVYLVRHAQGTHNLASHKLGVEILGGELARSEEFLDPDLTPFGIEDSKSKGPPSIKAELERGMPPIERVVVSPLSRSMQTAQHFFAKNQRPDSPFVCLENCREILDCCTFDKRLPLSAIKAKFPDVDFSHIKSEQDRLWSPTHYETQDEIYARAEAFLSELFDVVPDRYVAVVSHVCFIQAVCSVTLGGTPPRFDNCEVVPLVLQRKAV